MGGHWLPAHHCFLAPAFRVLTWGQLHLSHTHKFLKVVSNGKKAGGQMSFSKLHFHTLQSVSPMLTFRCSLYALSDGGTGEVCMPLPMMLQGMK